MVTPPPAGRRSWGLAGASAYQSGNRTLRPTKKARAMPSVCGSMGPSPGTLLAAGHEDWIRTYEIRITEQNHSQGHIHQKRSDYVAGKVRRDDPEADGVGPDHRISSG